jgi:hypothetical protein
MFRSIASTNTNKMKHLLLTPQQYEAVMKRHLLYGQIDYARFNDPNFAITGSGPNWVVYLKCAISPTMAFDIAWYSK